MWFAIPGVPSWLLAGIGGLVFRIFGWVCGRSLAVGQLKAAGQRPSEARRRLLRAILVALTVVLVAIFLGIAFLVFYPSTQRPNFQPVDQHIYLSEGAAGAVDKRTTAAILLLHAARHHRKGSALFLVRGLRSPAGKAEFASPSA